MTHDELQRDLAGSFAGNGEVIVEKLSLGSFGTAGQMDVFRMKLSRTNPNPTCYEVKVSRGGFLSDTQAGKYRRYMPYVRRLYFAAPSGLLRKADIPAGCGLIVRGANSWSVTKAAPIHQPEPDRWTSLLMSIVLKLHPGPWQQPDREKRIRSALELASADSSLRHLGLRLSAVVARQISEAREAVQNERWARHQLAERLGLDPEAPEARDIAHLANEVLRRAPKPAELDDAVPRKRIERLIREAEMAQRVAAQLLDGLVAALNGRGS